MGRGGRGGGGGGGGRGEGVGQKGMGRKERRKKYSCEHECLCVFTPEILVLWYTSNF